MPERNQVPTDHEVTSYQKHETCGDVIPASDDVRRLPGMIRVPKKCHAPMSESTPLHRGDTQHGKLFTRTDGRIV